MAPMFSLLNSLYVNIGDFVVLGDIYWTTDLQACASGDIYWTTDLQACASGFFCYCGSCLSS